MFPSNNHREKYKVNFWHIDKYRNSAVPYCQMLLNDDNKAREAAGSARSGEGGLRDGTVEVARRREKGG